MATFMIAVAGTSLVVFVLISAKASRGARRSSAAGDGAASGSSGDALNLGWLGGDSSGSSASCSGDSFSGDSGGGDCGGGGGDGGGGGSGD
ncbi:hypothetical protein UP09_00115 [Bradyrhizobium sp. LTSP885]|nr:hypothetical protein UP09_00115 [Bradyrhizobium sp. LTSP885]